MSLPPLLKHLWSDPQGHRIIMALDSKKVMHKFYWDGDTGAIDQQINNQGTLRRDLFMACAIFDEGKKEQAHVTKAKAFWLDLDVGKTGNKYRGQKAAINHVTKFCKLVKLHPPLLINSGYGIHAYWLLSDYVSRETWSDTADRLHAACKIFGLLSDPTRTRDESSLMRIPDTLNWKNPDDPKMVKALNKVEPVDPRWFRQLLVNYAGEGKQKQPMLEVPDYATSDKNHLAAGIMANIPCYADQAADGCLQLKQMRDTGGDISEPAWYAAISVMRLCDDGANLIHDWSSGHPDYDKSQTDAKVRQLEAKDMGPATCEQFQNTPDGELCQHCTHYKTDLKSPIMLGKRPDPIEIPPDLLKKAGITDSVTEAKEADAEVVNDRWVIAKDGVYFIEPDVDKPTRVTSAPMWIQEMSRGDEHSGTEATIRHMDSHGKYYVNNLPIATLAEPKSVMGWLFDLGIQPFDKGKVIMFLAEATAKKLAEIEADTVIRKFGWNDTNEKFFLGEKAINGVGVATTKLHGGIKGRIHGIESVGDINQWVKSTEILREPRSWPHAFTMLASMGTPLLKLCNIDGAVLSLAGPSGTGKTTAVEFALSVWGKSKTLLIAPDSTMNAIGGLMSMANNIPIAVDDISAKHQKRLAGLVYMAANGRSKDTMTQTREVRAVDPWCTSMLVTTNNHLNDMPNDVIAEAEKRRILEITVNAPLKTAHARIMHDTVFKHYGLVGPQLVSKYIKHMDKAIKMTKEKMYEFEDSVSDVNRFGIWMLATAYTAGQFAKANGFIAFDPDSCINDALNSLQENSASMMSGIDQAKDALSSYFSRNYGSITFLSGKTWSRTEYLTGGRAAGVYKPLQDTLYIPIGEINDHFVKMKVPLSHLRELRKTYKLQTINQSIVKGSGMQRCIMIPGDTGLLDTDELVEYEPGKSSEEAI